MPPYNLAANIASNGRLFAASLIVVLIYLHTLNPDPITLRLVAICVGLIGLAIVIETLVLLGFERLAFGLTTATYIMWAAVFLVMLVIVP